MNILVTAALAFFFAVGLGLAAAGGIRAAWRGLGRRRGVSAALAAFAVIATICAQKPGPSGPTITIDALLRDAGCYATNDVFHAAVSNAPAYAAIDFSACPVLVYARERGQTNAADWAELTPRRTFSELPADYAIANATNYNYIVYLDYVPPSPVHTNGVFELHGFVIPGYEPGNLEQLAAGFINSRAIPPPYDAEVEYLKSTGTQWIDTSVVPSVGCSMEIDAAFTNNPVESYLGGVHWDNNRGFAVGIVKNLNSSKFTALAGHSSVSAGSIDTQRHKFSLIINTSRSATFSVDDSSATNGSITFLASDLKIPLLARRRSSSTLDYHASAFLYACKIRVGDVLVRDYIAVRKGSVGYLYDKVSGQLFGNAGTGAFIVGPDK
jgi:hypothetical protein